MPATWRMARNDSRITAERTRLARRSRNFLICRRSKKEYESAIGNKPAFSHPASCRAEMRNILKTSDRSYLSTRGLCWKYAVFITELQDIMRTWSVNSKRKL